MTMERSLAFSGSSQKGVLHSQHRPARFHFITTNAQGQWVLIICRALPPLGKITPTSQKVGELGCRQETQEILRTEIWVAKLPESDLRF